MSRGSLVSWVIVAVANSVFLVLNVAAGNAVASAISGFALGGCVLFVIEGVNE